MKNLATHIVLALFALALSVPAVGKPAERDDTRKQATILSCASLSDGTKRTLCIQERNLRLAMRALDILTFGSDEGATHGGASDCAATAEADCNSVLDDVGSLDWDGEVCVWTCIAIVPPSGSGN